jgi:hypothetical protein
LIGIDNIVVDAKHQVNRAPAPRPTARWRQGAMLRRHHGGERVVELREYARKE